jgi:hypothetical protein
MDLIVLTFLLFLCSLYKNKKSSKKTYKKEGEYEAISLKNSILEVNPDHLKRAFSGLDFFS